MDNAPIYTIGYGNRSFEEFAALLQKYNIHYLIDVRSHPYSNYKKEFSKESLENNLKIRNIKYLFLGNQLGGLPADENCYTEGKVDYIKCRNNDNFRLGIARIKTAWKKNLMVALMCGESKPEECHRTKLIGEWLTEEGVSINHIDEKGNLMTQEQTMNRLTGGKVCLFGPLPGSTTSRKRYRIPETSKQ